MSELCARKYEHAGQIHQCSKPADGGIRMTLRCSDQNEQRWGIRTMLSMILDLPVCRGCLVLLEYRHVTDQDQRKFFNQLAQRNNHGILPDWSRTQLELVTFDDPTYVRMREQRMREEAAANDVQPQGAGDGDGSEQDGQSAGAGNGRAAGAREVLG